MDEDFRNTLDVREREYDHQQQYQQQKQEQKQKGKDTKEGIGTIGEQ